MLEYEGEMRMRKHFYKFVTMMCLSAACLWTAVPALAAEKETIVDSIVIEDATGWDEGIPADLKWKTMQDKGQWIDELGVGADASSLILIINNLDKEDTEAMPEQGSDVQKEQEKARENLRQINGKSRLSYFSKGLEGEWQEVVSVECYISGGDYRPNEEIYGVYSPGSSFGTKLNPGSLLPFQSVRANDYWFLSPDSEHYGTIYRNEDRYQKPTGAINLSGMKTLFSYGLILNAADPEAEVSALMVNCLQSDRGDDTMAGVRIPEHILRMLVQSVDENTKIVIAGSLETIGDQLLPLADAPEEAAARETETNLVSGTIQETTGVPEES